MVEPIAVPDDFVSGIGRIEFVGKYAIRFSLYAEHIPIDGSSPVRVMVRKIIIPIDTLPKAVRKMLRFMALHDIDIGGPDHKALS